ncbi:MAG: VanZ family protein [Phycisphaeraceae bacterium]
MSDSAHDTTRWNDPAHLSATAKRWLTMLVLLAAFMTMWLLLYPFDFQQRPATAWLGERHLSQLHRINFVSNLVLFLPLGLLAGWRMALKPARSRVMAIVLVTLMAGTLSLVGETLQQWLPAESAVHNGIRPPRTSSLLDLIANTFGAAIAAAVGVKLAESLTARWLRIGAWLSRRPTSRRALAVFIIVLLARLAPFDVSPETYYLSSSLRRDMERSGFPFSATRRWLAMRTASPFGAAHDDAKAAAMAELRDAGVAFGLFLALALALQRAQREDRRQRGPSASSRAWLVMVLGIAAVMGTELMHWPIRSRSLDTTEPAVGLAALVLGLALASVGRVKDGAARGPKHDRSD